MKNNKYRSMNHKDINAYKSLYELMPHDDQSREEMRKRSNLIAHEIKIQEETMQKNGCVCVNFGTKDKFGIPYNGVVEVCSTQLITPLPYMPDIVSGITNWRGKILTVVNLANLLWSESGSEKNNGKLIIINNCNLLVALQVNEIIGSLEYGNATLEPALPLKGVINPEYISGINHTSVSILNMDVIFEKIQSEIVKWRMV